MVLQIIVGLCSLAVLACLVMGIKDRDWEAVRIAGGVFLIGAAVSSVAMLFLIFISTVIYEEKPLDQVETYKLVENAPVKTDSSSLEVFVYDENGQIAKKEIYAESIDIQGKNKIVLTHADRFNYALIPWVVRTPTYVKVTD
jgi:hypothetical protein